MARSTLLQSLLLACCFSAWRCLAVKFQDAPSEPFFKKTYASGFEHKTKQWSVDPEKHLLTIFMPVVPTELELSYLRNHLHTLHRYVNTSAIYEFFIVTPDKQLKDVRAFLDEAVPAIVPEARHDFFRLVPEGECVSELAGGTKYETNKVDYPGWIRQQLVKLGCARLLKTPYYLVVDADVLYVRNITSTTLFKKSECIPASPVCDSNHEFAYQAMGDSYPIADRTENQRSWWKGTAKTLQLSVPIDWREAIGVTPQILSTDISRKLGEYIETRFKARSWSKFLLDYLFTYNKRLVAAKTTGDFPPPWTEYTLYWIYAAHADVWDDYHCKGQLVQSTAIWDEESFEAWDACQHSFDWQQGYMTLVQSRTQIEGERIWAKIAHCFYWLDVGRHEWAAKEKLKEEEKAKQEAAALAAEEAALEEAEMNAPAGVHFGALPATRTGGASADPAGAVAGDLSTSAAGLQQGEVSRANKYSSTTMVDPRLKADVTPTESEHVTGPHTRAVGTAL
ncbi:hypothetical protein WJX74_003045 [Apatococcus lobatus]|uniref:Nucleotide-diphospho-sugar transferase n=1 Tax=Apatococcus lobatus TaxID=904363 RepID=A0AAW1SEQ9_9CHLO